MPDVTGLTIPQAQEKVLTAGRGARASSARAIVYARQSNARPAGQIIRQLEPPGTQMRAYLDDVGGKFGEVTFRVVVSTGPQPAPNFVGETVAAALQYAERNKILVSVGTGQMSPQIPRGIVMRQDPAAGQPMPRRRVIVYPSTGYPLPNYVEQKVELARRDSRRLGFDLREQRQDSVNVPLGVILRQSPQAETLLPLDRPVNVVVSDGWPTPNFLRLEENDAAALAVERRVNLRVAERRQDRQLPPGIVIDQKPPPGARLAPAQPVDVVVSATDPTPRLIGLTEEEASVLAARRDFNLVISRETSMDVAFGLVIRQSPGPGKPLPGDGRVSVAISRGQLTPDFVGRTEEDATGIAADMDITLVRTSPAEHFELSAGRIIEQQPVAGVVMPRDRRVNISLSLGWPESPDALGRSAGSVRREFLARHPNAIIEQSEKLLITEPAGTVISQHPQPQVKLGPKQQLHLVVSATTPPWLWAVGGVVLVGLALGGFALLKKLLSPSKQTSFHTEDPGGVRLRITKDHGVQTTDIRDDGDRDHAKDGDIVKIRVKVDLGEQTVGPKDDKGDET